MQRLPLLAGAEVDDRLDYYLQARARLRTAQGRLTEALDDPNARGSIEEAFDVSTPQNTTWRSDAGMLPADVGRAAEGGPLVDEALARARALSPNRSSSPRRPSRST